MSLFSDWQYDWFGIWRNPSESVSLPLLEELQDFSWNSPVKNLLEKYLQEVPIAVVTSQNPVSCELCGELLGDPSCYKFDNTWLWPSDLVHFIKRHQVRLPDRMVDDIVRKQFVPPTDIAKDATRYPWPKVQ